MFEVEPEILNSANFAQVRRVLRLVGRTQTALPWLGFDDIDDGRMRWRGGGGSREGLRRYISWALGNAYFGELGFGGEGER